MTLPGSTLAQVPLISPILTCGFDFEDINHFFFNCPLFGAERTELLTNLLTLGITNVNLSLCVTMMKNLIRMYLNLFIIS